MPEYYSNDNFSNCMDKNLCFQDSNIIKVSL